MATKPLISTVSITLHLWKTMLPFLRNDERKIAKVWAPTGWRERWGGGRPWKRNANDFIHLPCETLNEPSLLL